MILKVFDVDQGSCNFIKTSTSKTELVDFGGKFNWSPILHIYNHYIDYGSKLDRLVLTHHHGDHLQDWSNFGGLRPNMVVRRPFVGEYLLACRKSNQSGKQAIAEQFASVFASWTHPVQEYKLTKDYWGLEVFSRHLSVEEAKSISATDNSLVNNCSYVRLYNHNGTKILLCGDMEKEGMALLLQNNPNFKSELNGVDVLVAPHHGHRSGFCTELFDATGPVTVVISSMMSGDNFVDSRYSDSQYVRGIIFDDFTTKRLLTTRTYGSMTVESYGNGSFYVTVNQR